MPRSQIVRLGAVNLRFHTRDIPEIYRVMFQRVRNQKVIAKYWGEKAAILQSFSRLSLGGEDEVWGGEIACFMEFDKAASWLDLDNGREATPEQLVAIEAIPDNLRPSYTQFSYLFFPRHHRLFVDSGLSPKSVVQIVNAWFAAVGEGRPYSVTVEQDREILPQIFSSARIQKIRIVIERPNPDHPGSFDAELEERMERLGAIKLDESVTAPVGGSVQPDEMMRQMAASALDNGSVSAVVYDENNLRRLKKTEDHPLIEGVRYEPVAGGRLLALVGLARQMLAAILRRNTPDD